MRTLYDLLEEKLCSFESIGFIRGKYISILFLLAGSSIPKEILKACKCYCVTDRRMCETKQLGEEDNQTIMEKDDLDSLLDFFQDGVIAESRLNLSSQYFKYSKSDQDKFPTKKSLRVINSYFESPLRSLMQSTFYLLLDDRNSASSAHCSKDCIKIKNASEREGKFYAEISQLFFMLKTASSLPPV